MVDASMDIIDFRRLPRDTPVPGIVTARGPARWGMIQVALAIPIADPIPAELNFFQGMRPMRTPTADLSPMKSVTQMRAVIDAFAALYAAARVKQGADPEPLLMAFDALQRAAKSNDFSGFIREDRVFHMAVVDLADVEGLPHVWRAAIEHQERFRVDSLRACWPDLNVLFEAHREIVDSICDGDGPAAELAARAHLDAVWYRLAEHTGDESLPGNPLDRACAFLAFNLSERIRLQTVARQVARTSPGHLARLFRERHGTSFSSYLRELRMHKAADMLRRTGLPVHRVARAVGYEDGSRFAQHFRKRYGLTPRQFRRQQPDR